MRVEWTTDQRSAPEHDLHSRTVIFRVANIKSPHELRGSQVLARRHLGGRYPMTSFKISERELKKTEKVERAFGHSPLRCQFETRVVSNRAFLSSKSEIASNVISCRYSSLRTSNGS